MKKNEIKLGGIYVAKVSGKLTTVRVTDIYARMGYGSSPDALAYTATNLATGRTTTFRSAQKFRVNV